MSILETAANGNLKLFNQYMEHKNIRAELNTKDVDGNTVLMVACKNGNIMIVAKITNFLKTQSDWPNCPEINQVNVMGQSPLMLTCRWSNNIYLIHYLLNVFPNINVRIRDNSGNDAILNACFNIKPNFIKILLQVQGIDVTIPNIKGFTPLIYAQKRLEMIGNSQLPGALNNAKKFNSIISHINTFLTRQQHLEEMRSRYKHRY